MSDAIALMRSAERAVASGNFKAAKRDFLLVVQSNENPEALIHLSHLESKEGNYRKAREYTQRALRARPTSPVSNVRLLNRLRSFNQSAAIRDLVASTPQLMSLDPKGLQAVSAQLSYVGDQQGALVFLDRALSLQPTNPAVLLARGQVNTFLGKFDEAEADLRACLMYAPDLGGAWWTLSRLRKQTSTSNNIDQLKMRLARPRSVADKAFLAYALHKELDDLGDFKAAAEALGVACRSKRAEVQYSDSQSRALFSQLKATDFDSMEGGGEHDHGFTMIFIVGMFRSGTTLLEQLLGANPQMTNAGELFDFPSSMRYAANYHCPSLVDAELVARSKSIDYREVATGYADSVRWRLGNHTHLTDKLPPNFLNAGYICKAFPKAKLIHLVRDPMETCFSNLRELFSGAASYSYDQRELAAYYLRYQDLMAHWRTIFPGRILDVDYAELTTDTAKVMRGVAEHCGLEFLPAMTDPRYGSQSVATASAVQVRNPVQARQIAKWVPYRDHLQPLIKGLGMDS